jgi:hypothetical protein
VYAASAVARTASTRELITDLETDFTLPGVNRLGVPVAEPGKQCMSGQFCVPCLDNKCFPRASDRMWHVVLEPVRAARSLLSS